MPLVTNTQREAAVYSGQSGERMPERFMLRKRDFLGEEAAGNGAQQISTPDNYIRDKVQRDFPFLLKPYLNTAAYFRPESLADWRA